MSVPFSLDANEASVSEGVVQAIRERDSMSSLSSQLTLTVEDKTFDFGQTIRRFLKKYVRIISPVYY